MSHRRGHKDPKNSVSGLPSRKVTYGWGSSQAPTSTTHYAEAEAEAEQEHQEEDIYGMEDNDRYNRVTSPCYDHNYPSHTQPEMQSQTNQPLDYSSWSQAPTSTTRYAEAEAEVEAEQEYQEEDIYGMEDNDRYNGVTSPCYDHNYPSHTQPEMQSQTNQPLGYSSRSQQSTTSFPSLVSSPLPIYGFNLPQYHGAHLSSTFESLSISVEETSDARKENSNSRQGYMSIKDPKGFYKPGRIFKTPENGSEPPLVAVSGDLVSSIICVSVSQEDKGEAFPVIQENPTADIGSSVKLDFDDEHTMSPTYDVMNIGRIDRKLLGKLKSRYEQARCTDAYSTDKDAIVTEDRPGPPGEVSAQGPEFRLHHSKDSRVGRAFKTPWSKPIGPTQEPPYSYRTVVKPPMEPEQKRLSRTSLDKDYKIYNSKEFYIGRVLKVLWTEPVGNGGNVLIETTVDSDDIFSSVEFGEKAYSSIRRFVIVKARKGHCMGLPILTYSGLGLSKKGVKVNDHTIIHMADQAPMALPGERQSNRRPVSVEPASARHKLALASRLNYNKLYTIEHNFKVCFIGEIHRDSKVRFFTDFEAVFRAGDAYRH